MSTIVDDVAPSDKGRGGVERPQSVEGAALFGATQLPIAGERYAVTLDMRGAPSRHHKPPGGQQYPEWAPRFAAGKLGTYFTPATFAMGSLVGNKGRTAANAIGCNSVWVDIEGSADKGGYDGAREVLVAISQFAKATELVPNFMVFTGSGGAHLYWCFDRMLTPDEWRPRAAAVVELCKEHGLKIDAPCTTDIARIMRAPGSVHQKTGKPVQVYRWKEAPYAL